MSKPRIVTVDAGIVGTGLAFWEEAAWKRIACPATCFNLIPPKRLEDWRERSDWLANEFGNALAFHNAERAYIEMPRLFESAIGQASAGSGDLLKLVFLVGMYAEVCRSMPIPCELIDVNLWKGQLPKRVVEARIKMLLPEIGALNPKSHSWDAIGIGLFVKGFFK